MSTLKYLHSHLFFILILSGIVKFAQAWTVLSNTDSLEGEWKRS